MNARDTQRLQMAGKTKLTLVRVSVAGLYRTQFVHLKHDERGHAVLPMHMFNAILRTHQGVTFTIG